MNRSVITSLAMLFLLFSATAQAIPVLQVGAPAGAGDTGTYADYQSSLTNPTETDTALTSGNILYVAGVFGKDVAQLGKYYESGQDWSNVLKNPPSAVVNLDTHGAILLASVPDGTRATAAVNLQISVDNATWFNAFYSSPSENFFGNNHDPVKENISDFLFFDIGNFANISGAVTNFADETGSADGQIRTVYTRWLDSTSVVDWIHYDLMALETTVTIKNGKKTPTTTVVSTDAAFNPGSHDVTWKNDGGGGGFETPVPEPSTFLLLGAGLGSLALWRRKRSY